MIAAVLLLAHAPNVLAVGDGKSFHRIEDAVEAAKPGDRIEVYPQAAGYPQTAVYIDKARLEILAPGQRITLDGAGFDYSGIGRTPRAIFQINRGADGVLIRNFELKNAHNGSFNGAGVRINAANQASVEQCSIHDNDMGIMSNGVEGDEHAGENQLIESCDIHHNGNLKDPGYNHNLYLGGTSVTLRFCTIHDSLTGHNLKSRAHFTLAEYCYIHDSANREIDLVEAWDTQRPNSNGVFIGDVIEKDPNCSGNRMVINFGAEKGVRRGTLYLIGNTILTSFAGPVVNLSSPECSASLERNVILNKEQATPELVALSGSSSGRATGSFNWLSVGYQADAAKLGFVSSVFGKARSDTPFENKDYGYQGPSFDSLAPAKYIDGVGAEHTVQPRFKYVGNGRWDPSKAATLGAG